MIARETPLSEAARTGADITLEPTALKGVCFIWNVEFDERIERVIDICVAAGLDVNDEDAAGYRPIHCAALYDSHGEGWMSSDGINVTAIAALVKHGAAIDVPMPDGWLPLHLAAYEGAATAVQTLLTAGADPRSMTPDGETALDLARGAVERHRRPPSEHIAAILDKGQNRWNDYEASKRKQVAWAEEAVALLSTRT